MRRMPLSCTYYVPILQASNINFYASKFVWLFLIIIIIIRVKKKKWNCFLGINQDYEKGEKKINNEFFDRNQRSLSEILIIR